MQMLFNRLYPMVLHFFAKGWSDDLDISFKKAVMNDVKNYQLRIIMIPGSFVLTMVTAVAALVFLLYGTSNFIMSNANDGSVALLTGSMLLAVAMIAATIFYINIQFLLRRVQSVQETVLRARELRPLQQLYQQIKEEQNMLLEAFLKNKQQKEYVYESHNIGTV